MEQDKDFGPMSAKLKEFLSSYPGYVLEYVADRQWYFMRSTRRFPRIEQIRQDRGDKPMDVGEPITSEDLSLLEAITVTDPTDLPRLLVLAKDVDNLHHTSSESSTLDSWPALIRSSGVLRIAVLGYSVEGGAGIHGLAPMIVKLIEQRMTHEP